MPTPVTAARLCLTEEAGRALDEAVGVARRRSHAQTTSQHAVSALLAIPNSILRVACERARSYFSRRQFQVLGACIGASLDRLTSTKAMEETPPVSNSLMAAIKRSQANQRRNPDIFHLQQIHGNSPNPSILKVELKHFILSILDDPIVNRLFGEAGFRSCDIKLAILHPPMTQSASSRLFKTRRPPLFLCNLSDSDHVGPGYSFPSVNPTEDNSKRIVEILLKRKGRSPLLIGACAGEALKSFIDGIQGGNSNSFPMEVAKLKVICIESEIKEFILQSGSKENMDLKLDSLKTELEHCSGLGSGILLNLGELSVMTGDDMSGDALGYVVSKLTELLKVYGEKLWFIGATASEEMYMKITSLMEDWDMHPLTISSSRNLMEKVFAKSSFVPLGGFFEQPPSPSMCHLCTTKYEQEVAVLKVRSTITTAQDHNSETSLPSLLPRNHTETKELYATKIKDDGTAAAASNSKILALKKRWTDICHHIHRPLPQLSNIEGSMAGHDHHARWNPITHINSQNLSLSKHYMATPVTPVAGNVNFQYAQEINASSSQLTDTGHSSSSVSPASVTTDLGLGTTYAFSSEKVNSCKQENPKDCFSGSFLAKFDHQNGWSSSSVDGMEKQFNFKANEPLFRVLTEKVGWQSDAICTICQAISRCQTGNWRSRASNSRLDIWLTLFGPDKVGKRKVASVLAEVIFGSAENLVSLDLRSQDNASSMFDGRELIGYDAVDFIARESVKKSHSVILLENIDKADLVVQNCLSKAITTGKFPDKHGREISLNNMIFVTTLKSTKGENDYAEKSDMAKFSEETILAAKRWKMQMVVGNGTKTAPCLNKRKLDMNLEMGKQAHKMLKCNFDLNLPAQEVESDSINYSDGESESISENLELWLDDFLDQVEEKVVFKPFGFDELATKLEKDITQRFRNTFDFEAELEIDHQVMVQILAAAWLSGDIKDAKDWIERVVGRGFDEIGNKYKIGANSVVKLVSCDGVGVEDEAPRVRLPARICVM